MIAYYECPVCRGVFLVQRTDADLMGEPLRLDEWQHRDGLPVTEGSPIQCDDCGIRADQYAFLGGYERQRRVVEALPPKAVQS